MPSRPDDEEMSNMDKVKMQLHQATSTMQDNMRAMAERDSQLNNLQARSNELQGVSQDFFRASRRVHRSQLWQQYRLYALAAVLVSWIVCWIVFPKYLISYIVFSLVVIAVAFLVKAYFTAKEKKQEELLAAQQ